MRGCFLDSLLTAVGLRMPARISERCSALPEPGESLGGGGVGFTGALRHEYLCWARGGPPCHNRASLSQAGSRAWGAASLSLGSRLICTQVDAGSDACPSVRSPSPFARKDEARGELRAPWQAAGPGGDSSARRPQLEHEYTSSSHWTCARLGSGLLSPMPFPTPNSSCRSLQWFNSSTVGCYTGDADLIALAPQLVRPFHALSAWSFPQSTPASLSQRAS